MFSDLRFIDTIDLAENQISEVQREAFKNIYLTKINMSHNFIEEMADNTFRNCENMTFLDLSHNYLYGMLPTVFGDNSYTLDLRLQFNYLTTMAGVPMDQQIGIKTLNVSYNQVRSIFFVKLHSINIFFQQEIISYTYLVRGIKPPNRQSCFPQFFPRIFLSFSS